jgi:hypothetical protein
MEDIPLQQVDTIYSVLGSVSRGNTRDPRLYAITKNPAYLGELIKKSWLYGKDTEETIRQIAAASIQATYRAS